MPMARSVGRLSTLDSSLVLSRYPARTRLYPTTTIIIMEAKTRAAAKQRGPLLEIIHVPIDRSSLSPAYLSTRLYIPARLVLPPSTDRRLSIQTVEKPPLPPRSTRARVFVLVSRPDSHPFSVCSSSSSSISYLRRLSYSLAPDFRACLIRRLLLSFSSVGASYAIYTIENYYTKNKCAQPLAYSVSLFIEHDLTWIPRPIFVILPNVAGTDSRGAKASSTHRCLYTPCVSSRREESRERVGNL